MQSEIYPDLIGTFRDGSTKAEIYPDLSGTGDIKQRRVKPYVKENQPQSGDAGVSPAGGVQPYEKEYHPQSKPQRGDITHFESPEVNMYIIAKIDL